MNQLVSMAGSPGPLEHTKGARTMSDVKTQEVVRRPRGRPRKNPEMAAHDQKKRGSQTSHGPEHYAEIRYKRKLAGITHKQFRILEEDEAEAERLLMPLIKKATMAYHRVDLLNKPYQHKIDEDTQENASGVRIEFVGLNPLDVPDPLDDPEPVALSQEPPTASLPEIEAAPVPEPAEKPKSIKERGKLSLKAFRKDAP